MSRIPADAFKKGLKRRMMFDERDAEVSIDDLD